jgi:hypothetical protein
MNKEQFNKLKVGDIVEYNSEGALKGCQFKINKLNFNMAEGTVTQKGASGCMRSKYPLGAAISGYPDYLTLISTEEAKPEPFATLELSVQEAAVAFYILRSVSGAPLTTLRGYADSIVNKLTEKLKKANLFDTIPLFSGYVSPIVSPSQLDEALVEFGLLKAPEKPKAADKKHKLKGPDGKFAPKNYRQVMYPEHGSGSLKLRHILMGEFVDGSAGTNVLVQEWDGKEWKPKTYSAAKIKPVK